jgi:predicted nucleic acid-binding Zn ribbon protein
MDIITKICDICGKEFTPKHRNIKVCSDECKEKRRLLYSQKHNPQRKRYCLKCGKEIPRNKYYCEACRVKALEERKEKNKMPKIVATCPICQKVFTKRFYSQITCSAECSIINHNKNNQKDRKKPVCIVSYGTTSNRNNKFGSFENFQNYCRGMLRGIDLSVYKNG